MVYYFPFIFLINIQYRKIHFWNSNLDSRFTKYDFSFCVGMCECVSMGNCVIDARGCYLIHSIQFKQVLSWLVLNVAFYFYFYFPCFFFNLVSLVLIFINLFNIISTILWIILQVIHHFPFHLYIISVIEINKLRN